MNRPSWDERIARARELAESYPFAAEALTFYACIAEFQRDVYNEIAGAPLLRSRSASFRDALDLSLIIARFPAFLRLVQHAGPPPIADASLHLEAEGRPRSEQLLRSYWNRTEQDSSPADTFFARAFLQPYAERIAERMPPQPAAANTPTCPACDSEPVVAVLRPEGYGAKRSFICSFCSTEWQHLRMMCPGCGEDDHEALCFYTAEQFDHVRVDACETCKTYIKTVDLTKNGLAIPVVDEIASLPLTLWAEENGYTRLQPNLIAV
jgi:formate dehydrogenase accessory protein FdhE